MSNPGTPDTRPVSREIELHRERGMLAAAGPDALTSRELYERAKVLARSKLVPKALENNPDGIFLVGSMGAELGVSLVQSLSEIHVIEGRPSPSAQLRLSLIRKHGHEARFLETSDEKAVITGRREEDHGDPNAWVTVTWTIEQARKAGLVDRWVEKRVQDGTWPNGDKKWKIEKFVVGDDRGIFDEAERRKLGLPVALPEWVVTELDAGKVKTKDNWQKYPADMLRARAASALFRMHFGDVVLAHGIDDLTPEERGLDTELDLEPGPRDAAHGADDDEIVDAELVEPDDVTPAAGSGPKLSGPAAISVVLKDRGIDDRDTKLRLVSAIVDREVSSTKDLTGPEVALVLRTIDYCKSNEELLAVIDEPGPGMDALRDDESRRVTLASYDDGLLSAGDVERLEGMTVDELRAALEVEAPAESRVEELVDTLEKSVEAAREARRAPRNDPPAPPRDEASGSPDSWSETAWRAFVNSRGVKVTELLKEAQRLAREDGEETVPTTLEALTSCSSSLLEILVGFVEDLAQQRGEARS